MGRSKDKGDKPHAWEDSDYRRKNREYFFLELRDADGAGPDRDHANAACAFTLALSGEHTGFTFERDLAKAEDMIRLHSGGENALALRALRGDRGDARELLATDHTIPLRKARDAEGVYDITSDDLLAWGKR